MTLPRLGVTALGVEREKEIYTICFAADNRPIDPNVPRESDLIAAYNETIPNMIPEFAQYDALRFLLMTVSNVFPRITETQDVSLSGNGIILYPPADPQGFLGATFFVVESDAGKRNFGKFLQTLMGRSAVQTAVSTLVAGVTSPAIAALMRALTDGVPWALQKNRDDLLFAHAHSGFDFDPDQRSADFEVGNHRAFATLRVAVIDD